LFETGLAFFCLSYSLLKYITFSKNFKVFQHFLEKNLFAGTRAGADCSAWKQVCEETGGFMRLLEVQNLAAGYKRTVLEGVNLSVGEGELIALVGPNGAGKTTLLKTIAGGLKPVAGRVLVNGKDVSAMGARERAGAVSFLFQSNAVSWPFSVREMVAQGRFHRQGLFGAESAGDRAVVEKAIADAGLAGFAELPVTELSGGEFQRVLIARLMAQGARLLLLDEPVNNLDPKYAFSAMDILKNLTRQSVTAIVSLHDLNLAALYADRVAVVFQGGVAAFGKPEEILTEAAIERVFEVSAKKLQRALLTNFSE
jgi:iron complex transport system ATP-binding protein